MHGNGGMCGYDCYEPITKEEKLAILEETEDRLQKKLEHIRKMKEALEKEKSEQTVGAGKEK